MKGLPLKADCFIFEPEVAALLVKKGIPLLELPSNYHGCTTKEGKKIKANDFFPAVAVLVC